MSSHLWSRMICFLLSLLVAGCGPGRLPEPTITPTPTFTLVPPPTVTSTSTPALTSTSAPGSACTETGCSLELAVIIEADNESDGIALEYQWLADHYPGYQNVSQAIIFDDDRIYDALTILTADGGEKTIYFDITLFYGHF